MTAAVAPVRAANLCETIDCGRYAGHVVSYDGLRKRVCRRCRDELVALWGWRLER